MSSFSRCIKKIFNSYRLLLRKSLSAQKKTEILNTLRLRVNTIREASDTDLYEMAERLSAFLKQELGETVPVSEHSARVVAISHDGIIPAKFLAHIADQLDTVLSEHIMHENHIAHVTHIASSALINIIQMIPLVGSLRPEGKDVFLARLDKHVDHVLQFGSVQQKATLYGLITQASQAAQTHNPLFASYLKKLV